MSENIGNIKEAHLGFIQSTIIRMGQNSFQAKAWCISVVAALLVFYISQDASNSNELSALVAIIATVFFCVVDTYYLYLERGYRRLYKVVAKNEKSLTYDYDMEIPKSEKGFKKFLKAFLSPSTGLFYGALIVFLILLILV